jgi:lysophospholipase L1-like esterase
MTPWRPRWRIGALAAVLLAVLALLHRTLLFPPHGLTMVEQPCAAVADSKLMLPEGDWAAMCAYHADNRRLIAAGIRPQLVLFGDSLFQDWGELQPGLFNDNWVNRGVRGQGTMRLLARFRPDVIALKPQTVIIAGGINDLIAADTLIGPDQYIANIESLVDLAEAGGITVILATLPPVDRFAVRPGFAPQALTVELNRRLRDLARRRGLVLADFNAVLVAPDGTSQRAGFSEDGIHPTAAAYRALEPVVRSALAEAEAKRDKVNR